MVRDLARDHLARAEKAERQVTRVEQAVGRHPEPCTDTPFSCGWKVRAAFNRSHRQIGGSPFCVTDPCAWHPGETRLRPPLFNPAVLVEGSPSLVVVDVLGYYASTALADQPEQVQP